MGKDCLENVLRSKLGWEACGVEAVMTNGKYALTRVYE